MSVKVMQVGIKVTELEVMKDLTKILADLVEDERLPATVMAEYIDRVNTLLEKVGENQ